MTPGERARPGAVGDPVAVGCLLLSVAMWELGGAIEEVAPELLPMLDIAYWLMERFDRMAIEPHDGAIAVPGLDEIAAFGCPPVGLAMLAEMVDDVSAAFRADALAPGAAAAIAAARGSEALAARLREASGEFEVDED